MSGLDDIKQRADERRSKSGKELPIPYALAECEADLDRAIEIAEGTILQLDWWLAENTLQVTCKCGNTFNAVPPYVRMKKERDQARADLTALQKLHAEKLDALSDEVSEARALAKQLYDAMHQRYETTSIPARGNEDALATYEAASKEW